MRNNAHHITMHMHMHMHMQSELMGDTGKRGVERGLGEHSNLHMRRGGREMRLGQWSCAQSWQAPHPHPGSCEQHCMHAQSGGWAAPVQAVQSQSMPWVVAAEHERQAHPPLCAAVHAKHSHPRGCRFALASMRADEAPLRFTTLIESVR